MVTRVKAIEAYGIVRECTGEGRSAAIRATGTSMLPFIKPGDIVTIAPMARYRRGDIVLALVGERHDVVLHAVISHDCGTYTLMGTANLKLTEETLGTDIAGAVVAIERDGRAISTLTPAWRRAMSLWLSLRPLRRLILKTMRIVGLISLIGPIGLISLIGPISQISPSGLLLC